MKTQEHWESVYSSKAPDSLSWYRSHLEVSLELIERSAAGRAASVIDIGAGESTLVDDLISLGYRELTMLDVSEIAIEATKKRLGHRARYVCWILGDVTQISLPPQSFDVWHDRAVFHFLTNAAQRQAYVRSVLNAVRPGGRVIVSTFGPEGPRRCSGLDVRRYDAKALHREFGRRFRIEESVKEMHRTPWGATQQFVYCCCRIE